MSNLDNERASFDKRRSLKLKLTNNSTNDSPIDKLINFSENKKDKRYKCMSFSTFVDPNNKVDNKYVNSKNSSFCEMQAFSDKKDDSENLNQKYTKNNTQKLSANMVDSKSNNKTNIFNKSKSLDVRNFYAKFKQMKEQDPNLDVENCLDYLIKEKSVNVNNSSNIIETNTNKMRPQKNDLSNNKNMSSTLNLNTKKDSISIKKNTSSIKKNLIVMEDLKVCQGNYLIKKSKPIKNKSCLLSSNILNKNSDTKTLSYNNTNAITSCSTKNSPKFINQNIQEDLINPKYQLLNDSIEKDNNFGPIKNNFIINNNTIHKGSNIFEAVECDEGRFNRNPQIKKQKGISLNKNLSLMSNCLDMKKLKDKSNYDTAKQKDKTIKEKNDTQIGSLDLYNNKSVFLNTQKIIYTHKNKNTDTPNQNIGNHSSQYESIRNNLTNNIDTNKAGKDTNTSIKRQNSRSFEKKFSNFDSFKQYTDSQEASIVKRHPKCRSNNIPMIDQLEKVEHTAKIIPFQYRIQVKQSDLQL